MGWAKKLMMEIQDQGDWPELYGKCICSRHYEDNYLKELIDKDATPGKCSYCGRTAPVRDMQKFAQDVTWKIHLHYNNADDEGLLLASSFYDDEKEVIPGFKRVGPYILPNDAEHFESALEMMEELGLISDNDELNEDIEEMFSTQLWVKKDFNIPDENIRLTDEWLKFAKEVTETRRFTFLAKPEFTNLAIGKGAGYGDILSKLSRIINEQHLCEILNKGTRLYRSRAVEDIDSDYGFKDLTSAPAKFAFPNRMSPAGIGVFYASFEEDVAKKECVGSDSHFVVGTFETMRDMIVIDLTKIPTPSFWMSGWQENLFLHRFHHEITKPLNEDDRNKLRYVPTQIFTEFLRYMFKTEKGLNVDGLIYGSAKVKDERNVVLFCNNEQSKDYVSLINVEKI